MMRRTLAAPLRSLDLGGGLWELTTAAPDAAQVYLKLGSGTNCAPLQQQAIRRLDLEWHAVGVSVRVTGADAAGVLEAVTVIIHEARAHLYAGLPLADFDAKARQFWRRVFLLIRIPGGRRLLRVIARRKQ